jgi:dTDP-4-dehydrorhamnose reductase
MKVLITGGSGALGKSLKKAFEDAYCPKHLEMDITDEEKVLKVILDYKPDVLIHTAAFVNVRGCEENKEKAQKVNVEGTQNIVNALKKLNNNCYLVYMSTACVFAGENEKFYTEDDEPDPKNYYSLTKLEGEGVVKQYENTGIIRTNFVPKEQWRYPKAFTDRFGTYLFADGVAKGIFEVVEKREKGIIHIVGDRRMSMYELALLAGSKNVGKMTLDEYEGPPVTVDMSLSTKRWKKYKIE